MTSRNSGGRISSGDIVKQGYLKKLKTMKKKYFVLRRDSTDVPARLDYYDSEKKFKANLAPKRTITLKTCFNINKPNDTRQKYVIALFTKKDRFCVVFDNEEEMEDWLKVLLELQHEGTLPAGEPARPNFEHVWQVTVLSKELGQRSNILGPYRLCLTDQTLSLVRPSTTTADRVDFSLQKIRRCGHVDSFFYMEVGQCTVTGAGNLWMQTEDTNIAENMHVTIMKACGNCTKKDLQPKSRNRSSSANEASKPVSLMQKWPTHTASSGSSGGGSYGPVNHQRTYSFPLSPVPPTRRASTGTRPTKCITSTSPQSSLTGVRERSDSMPSRARTTSECAPPPHVSHPPRYVTSSQYRPHSMYNRGVSYSPPVGSSPVSPASAACSTDSAGSSLSMDGDTTDNQWDDQGRYGHSLTPDEPVILEENPDDYPRWQGEDEKLNNYMPMDTSYCLPIQSNTSFNNTIYRKYSPNPSSSGFKSSSPSQASSYIDMCSPCGSSPMDAPGNYLPMSPGENRIPIYGKNVGNHSRGSSLTEDGYVPMAPGASDDGYVDMDHGPNRNKQERYQSGDLSTSSSCSVTSGTPSTDLRFNEYPLDKITSYFVHEEDITPTERPARAYSVGSRPTYNNNRSDVPAPNTERTRAFSVGSKNVRVNPMRMLMHNPPTHTSSHSSMEPSDDMMELDFSKKGRMKIRKKPSSSERLSVPGGSASTLSSVASSYSTAEGSYMEMSLPCSSSSIAPSPPKHNRFFVLLGKSPPKPSLQEVHSLNKASPPVSGYPSPSLGRVPEAEPGYVEMTIKSDPQSTSPVESCTCATHSTTSTDDAYVEMKPGQVETKPVIATNSKARVDFFPVTDQQKNHNSSSNASSSAQNINKDDYFDVNLKRKIPLAEDNNNSKLIIGRTPPSQQPDYVVMDLGNKSLNSSITESKDNSNSDYLNMSCKKEEKKKRKDNPRFSSQPITIQSSAKDSSNPIYSMAGRKHSTGTPPKVPSFLPLGGTGSPSSSPYSTLGRKRHKENVRKESNYAGPFSFILHSPSDSADYYDQSPKVPIDGTSGTLKISYSETNLSEKRNEPKIVQDCSDYVDYEPGQSVVSTPATNTSSTDDYVPMAPSNMSSSSKPLRKTSVPNVASKIRPLEKLLSGLGCSFSTLSMNSSPIVTLPPSPVKSESETLIGDDAIGLSDEETDGTASKSGNTDSSRKSSVTSVEKKELHYASLDLVVRTGSVEGEDANRNLNSQTSHTESSNSTPSPNVSSTADATAFNYAEIDFAKSGSSSQKTIH